MLKRVGESYFFLVTTDKSYNYKYLIRHNPDIYNKRLPHMDLSGNCPNFWLVCFDPTYFFLRVFSDKPDSLRQLVVSSVSWSTMIYFQSRNNVIETGFYLEWLFLIWLVCLEDSESSCLVHFVESSSFITTSYRHRYLKWRIIYIYGHPGSFNPAVITNKETCVCLCATCVCFTPVNQLTLR